MKNFAVVLSGSGHKDGSEITEAVSALISLSEANAGYQVFAPKMNAPAVNHLTNQDEAPRQVMAEAARIARGQVKNLSELKASDFDGLVFPGGYGAAKVLCSFAQHGANCEVLPEVAKVIEDFYKAEKPIAAICIAPALIARVLGKKGITVTIGHDAATAAEIRKTGAQHENCAVTDYVTDREHRLVTTPAYMYDDAKPHQVFQGIRSCIKEFVEMA
ncbi:MAG: isoprenoid biosynthesis glyoxalase ElbB [Bdellovibrionales bacterium]